MSKPKKADGGFAAKVRGVTNRLLHNDESEVPAADGNAAGTPLGDKKKKSKSEERIDKLLGFTSKLNQLLIQQTHLPVGQINLISLAQLRDQMGDRWPGMVEHVHGVAVKVLEEQILGKDIFSRYTDLEYVIVCANMKPQSARVKCAAIADEIYQRVAGDDRPEEVAIRITVERTPNALIFADATMSDILAETADEPGHGTAMPSASEGAWTSADAARQELAWPDAGAFADNDPSMEDGHGEGQEKLGDSDSRESFDAASVELIFRPVWSVRRQVISTFYGVPCRLCSNGEILYGNDILPEQEDQAKVAWLDAICAAQCLDIQHEMISNRFPLNVGVSVAYETLATSQYRDRYLQLYRQITKPMRSRLLLEIRDIPTGTPQGRISELTNRLRPFCQAVFALTDLQAPNLENFTNTGVNAIGVSLKNEAREERLIIKDLERFIQMSEALGLANYVLGARTTSLTIAAAAGGATYISGDRVAEDLTVPVASVRYSIHDFYARRSL